MGWICRGMSSMMRVRVRLQRCSGPLQQGQGVEVVVEHTGEKTWERSIQSLSYRGRLVTCGATSGPNGFTDLRFLFSKRLSLLGSFMGSRADLLAATPHFFAGRLKTHVHVAMALDQAQDAHRMMEASEHFGKIVLLA